MIKNAKTIAEYAIRKWMEKEGLQMEWFNLKMNGSEGIITDSNSDSMKVRYDKHTHEVIVG